MPHLVGHHRLDVDPVSDAAGLRREAEVLAVHGDVRIHDLAGRGYVGDRGVRGCGTRADPVELEPQDRVLVGAARAIVDPRARDRAGVVEAEVAAGDLPVLEGSPDGGQRRVHRYVLAPRAVDDVGHAHRSPEERLRVGRRGRGPDESLGARAREQHRQERQECVRAEDACHGKAIVSVWPGTLTAPRRPRNRPGRIFVLYAQATTDELSTGTLACPGSSAAGAADGGAQGPVVSGDVAGLAGSETLTMGSAFLSNRQTQATLGSFPANGRTLYALPQSVLQGSDVHGISALAENATARTRRGVGRYVRIPAGTTFGGTRPERRSTGR